MSLTSVLTSEVPLISSVHGETRRDQRDINKHDLKAAVKYGKKEPGHADPKTGARRWKYTFADVVYITDATSTREITSYAVPLPFSKVVITIQARRQYEEGKRRIREDPSSVTSHTVFVVDKSGSMRNSDVSGHYTRARAVFYSMGEEYLAPLLHRERESHTDLISVIEMREEPSVVVRREPRSWMLYNRFVDLSENRDAKNHGFYLNTLSFAFSCLTQGAHSKCALSLIFLSDGRPSDKGADAHSAIVNLVKQRSAPFADRFSFIALGFGSDNREFATLKDMTVNAKASGAEAMFVTGLDSSALKTAFSSASSSLTRTRTLLSRLVPDSATHEIRQLTAPAGKEKVSSDVPFDASHWTFYNGGEEVGRVTLHFVETVKDGYSFYLPEWREEPFLHPAATGIAIRKQHFDEGAERIVFRMREIDRHGRPVGKPLVAKDGKYRLEKDHDKIAFHKRFARTQRVASNLAKKFNERLDRLRLSVQLPRVEFISCSVYYCNPPDGSSSECFLAEPEIDSTVYKKWNDNQGRVDGIVKENVKPSAEQFLLAADAAIQLASWRINVVHEEDEESEEGDGDAEAGSVPGADPARQRQLESIAAQVLECDIPQAFSHFTCVHTKRKKLVCDIQGVLHDAPGHPKFLLTDPCIHYNDRPQGGGHRTRKYGRTDHGFTGFKNFFKTHQCNKACELLGLSADQRTR